MSWSIESKISLFLLDIIVDPFKSNFEGNPLLNLIFATCLLRDLSSFISSITINFPSRIIATHSQRFSTSESTCEEKNTVPPS